jgi:putative transposase
VAFRARKTHRPQLHRRDRFFWVILSRLWKYWREVLIIVKPETVIKWHRQGFKLYWRWKSKAPVGRPKIDKEIRELFKRMSLENPLWGTPRIQSELRLLGFDIAESTVAKCKLSVDWLDTLFDASSLLTKGLRNTQWRAPYYWAAFALLGEWR